MSKEVTLALPEKVLLKRVNFDPTVEYHLRDCLRPSGYSYSVMFGPPFTSGKPHIGTLYSQLVKEILTSLKFVAGFRVSLKPGFDCYGLPTENLVQKESRVSGKDSMFSKCLRTSRRNMIQQVAYFRLFGILASWDRPYATASLDYGKLVSRSLRKLALGGNLKLGFREVDYCPISRSIAPLSEIETVRDETVELYVAFRCLEDPSLHLLIWTTTP